MEGTSRRDSVNSNAQNRVNMCPCRRTELIQQREQAYLLPWERTHTEGMGARRGRGITLRETFGSDVLMFHDRRSVASPASSRVLSCL